ncbi:hypothetical protein GCM10022393_01800 [Aquimarina addita]|uniref:Phosphatidic acid phosphatase type 2/haloperoxidase domain-containing protein n=1 Tax=Aquimarina addita TaxID=870485 RepID=A0ABP7X9B1_9FLAO
MNKNIYLTSLLVICLFFDGFSQNDSPYETNVWKDGAWVTAGLGLNAYGLFLISNKDDLTDEKLDNLSEDDLFFMDRWAAGYDDENASKISDIPFYSSFATPLLLLIDKRMRKDAGKISVMYVESMATTGALFAITAGLVEKSRPRVYNEELSRNIRLSSNNQRSFFSGHVAASATATFFAAKVYSDYFPDSKAKPYIWAGAALIPATVGAFRIKSGNHFLSDVLIGYAVGAASGIMVPYLHTRKESKLKVSPGIGFHQQTLNISYQF